MFNNVNTMLFFLSIIVIFVVAMVFIVRTVVKDWRIRKTRPTINHEYTEGQYVIAINDENGEAFKELKKYDHELVTDLCQFCNQVDHIHIDSKYIQGLIDYNHKNIGIGELMVWHILNGDEHRINHFINEDNEYVSSQIPTLDLRNMEERLTDELSINGVD